MSPRTGRPKVENPKSVDVKIRIDKELNAKLLVYCDVHGVTRVEAIRQGIHLLLAQKEK